MNEIIYYIEFLPLFVMSFMCGFVRFARNENELINENEDEKKAIKLKRTRFLRVIDIVLTSAISGVIVFACLGHFFNLPYLVQMAIASAFALYGVDKMLDLIYKIWELKGKK